MGETMWLSCARAVRIALCLTACVPLSLSAAEGGKEIASLRMGHAGEKAKVVPMLVGNTCKLNIVTSQNKPIQVIELPRKNWCPDANFFATFDPNQDGYDDFVTVIAFLAGPFPATSAWLYSPEEKKYVRDEGFPGGWPTGEQDSGCIMVEARIGVGGGEHVYTEDVYCYDRSAHEWVESSGN